MLRLPIKFKPYQWEAELNRIIVKLRNSLTVLEILNIGGVRWCVSLLRSIHIASIGSSCSFIGNRKIMRKNTPALHMRYVAKYRERWKKINTAPFERTTAENQSEN